MVVLEAPGARGFVAQSFSRRRGGHYASDSGAAQCRAQFALIAPYGRGLATRRIAGPKGEMQ